ncbi:synembryn family protein [Pleurotus pulmonarius]
MMALSAYLPLTSSSQRSQVAAVLDDITNAFLISETERRDLISNLLKDLEDASRNTRSGRLFPEDAPRALLALKTLGKHPSGSAVIAQPANLSALLTFSTCTAFKDYPEASNEALRCIANAMLLVDSARSTWTTKEVGGGDASIKLLEKSTSPDRLFLASRLLFLTTVSSFDAGSYICSLVEEKHIVDTIAAKLDILSSAILSSTKMGKEATVDMLKFTFNLLLHYPKLVECEPQDLKGKGPVTDKDQDEEDDDKVMGDYWSPKLEGLLPPLLRIFNTLPPSHPSPLAAPLTHAIHGLITIPITPSLKPVWFGAAPRARTSSSRSSRSASLARSQGNQSANAAPSSSSSGSNSPTSPSSAPKHSTLERAFNALSAGARSLTRTPSPLNSLSKFDTVLRAYDLLDVSLAHFFPGNIDPDDQSVKDRCTAECGGDTTLDELISPLVVLVTRMCLADESCRTRVRNLIVPPDLDRKSPLESRSDILGRCLRLLACVYHDRLKTSVGEMLFAMCDSDATTLSALVGYGNVAGFLFNKGIMNAPPANTSTTSDSPIFASGGAELNPITGTEVQKVEVPEMTDEEKEREAEKLFILFDRLERTGALPPSQNPIRKAIAEGKIPTS